MRWIQITINANLIEMEKQVLQYAYNKVGLASTSGQLAYYTVVAITESNRFAALSKTFLGLSKTIGSGEASPNPA